ncbi:hypothetical protein [Serratia phage X20]|uniref:Uncharacterized protein n=1 Tax=Serratia phage X20 TaxID=2006942 RepID=A0A1Z1LYZ6_9CAUD|nr:hypothetical protein KNT72_gp076 [Serratia phage X20]ARW58049.1 hypothetical protein [Serratia phage X20]
MIKIDLVIVAGDQVDLESAFTDHMIQRAKANPSFAFNNQWGESKILQGKELHTIQWSYVGIEEEYDVNDNVVGYRWEYGEPDFQVDCSWCDDKNYQGE